MKTDAALAESVARHGRALFGREVGPSELRIAPVARATRSIFRVEAAGHEPAVIAKLRSCNNGEDRRIVALETSREFALLSAVWNGLEGQAPSAHRVPRPLLVLPESGLLFMEQSPGAALATDLRRWIVGLRGGADISRRIFACGEWLRSYSGLTPWIAWPAVSPDEAAIFENRRARHHVYRLVGRSGGELAQAVIEGATRRLIAYKVDAVLTRRIEAAFHRQFEHFSAERDLQGAVHGKYTPADVLIHQRCVSAVDLEQAGMGSQYLDVAYFLYQVLMVTRWRPLGLDRRPASQFRRVFLNARFGEDRINDGYVDAFVAYYLVNSLRPGGGTAGWQARSYAARWLQDWVARVKRGEGS